MTASSYANALYDLSVEENVADEIYSQIDLVAFAFSDNPELSEILDRPGADKGANISLIDKCFGNLNLFLVNCIKVMSKRRVTSFIPQMADEFSKLYRKDNGIEIVNVISAVQLNNEQVEKLKSKLEKKLNKKIILNCTVSPEILGGMIIRTESSQIDGSVKTRLEEVEKQIKSAVI